MKGTGERKRRVGTKRLKIYIYRPVRKKRQYNTGEGNGSSAGIDNRRTIGTDQMKMEVSIEKRNAVKKHKKEVMGEEECKVFLPLRRK